MQALDLCHGCYHRVFSQHAIAHIPILPFCFVGSSSPDAQASLAALSMAAASSDTSASADSDAANAQVASMETGDDCCRMHQRIPSFNLCLFFCLF